MTGKPRIRVAVLYGGRSSEHEVSLRSAKCVIDNLDPARFEVLPVGIDRQGRWHAQDLAQLQASLGDALPMDTSTDAPSLPATASGALATPNEGSPAVGPIDVVFPVVHGQGCEDGTLQGMLELSQVAYVGAGVLGSAMAMDKDVAKRLVAASGVPIAEYVVVRARGHDPRALRAEVARELGYPVFVKPASLGSSVGVARVPDEAELDAAVRAALAFDEKVLVERGVDAREIELAVLESASGGPPEVSVPGEIVPAGDFYDYAHKYLDADGAKLLVPAPLSAEQSAAARALAARCFELLECEGMARIDLFLDRERGRLLFNEANTLPGFTTISMYPKLWEASGLPYAALLTRLIELALARHARRSMLRHELA
jgi:D-alanine-D-alanine ligase